MKIKVVVTLKNGVLDEKLMHVETHSGKKYKYDPQAESKR